MQVTVEIPDDLAPRILTEGRPPSDAALESLGLEAYRAGRLSQHELQILLRLASRFEVEQLLKDRGVLEGAYGIEAWDQDEATAQRVTRELSSGVA